MSAVLWLMDWNCGVAVRRCRRFRRSLPRLGAWHPDAARAWWSPRVRGGLAHPSA